MICSLTRDFIILHTTNMWLSNKVATVVLIFIYIGTMITIGVIELHQQPDIWENPKV